MKSRIVAYLFIILIFWLINPVLGKAQSPIEITQDQVESDFPNKLTFQLSASSSAEITGIYLLYRTNAVSCQPSDARQEVDFRPSTNVSATWEWDFTLTGILPPGAQVYWQWEIHDADGNSLTTDEQSYLINDPRHTWNLLKRGQVNLQWYEGSGSFGQTLADLADASLERLAANAGIRPVGTTWLTIYPTTEELKLVDIHTTEWAGGLAYTEYNSSIIAIGPSELEWAAFSIPHELAHLVTDASMFNCKGMWLPTWLNEGLSMISMGDIPQGYIDLVTDALDHDRLLPLRTLESGFSSDPEAASLSYGHSGMVVNYMLTQYGAEKMAGLLEAIKSGSRIDKALTSVYGKDTDAIEAEWRVSLGYDPQPTLVPTSSSKTSVPTLALWTSVVRPSITPTSSPTATAQPQPTGTPSPIPSLPPTQVVQATIPSSGDPTTTGSSSPNSVLYLILAITLSIAVIAITLVIILVKRRKKK